MSLHESLPTNFNTISTVQQQLNISTCACFFNLRNVTPAYLHVLLGYRGFFLVGAVVEGRAGGESSDSMAIICTTVWGREGR